MESRGYLRWGWAPLVVVLAMPGAAFAADGPAVSARVTGLHRFDGGFVVLSDERVRVRTKALRAPAGATVVVRIVQDGRELRLRRHTVGTRTTFSDAVRASGGGVLTVRVRLAGPDGKPLARRPTLRAGVLQPTASMGARGTRVRYLQRSLAALRYAIAVTGRYDDATRRAVIAFRKVNRMKRVGNASRAVFSKVALGRGGFRPRHRGAAHVEGDLTRQVLALVNRGGRVFKVYMTSSGRPGLTTPAGVHTFYRKSAGWNSSGMLDSAYFTHASGPRTDCAIHGYFVVPIWNASHCCFRVPIPDARKIFNWVRIGQRIHVYH
jgi:peptidoglycan hydrolase-like protein with peptidoglycan-binding domain